MRNNLTIDGRLSSDRRGLVISPEIKMVVDPAFYKGHKFGKLGLMPKDINFSEESSGIDEIVREDLGVERFGNLTMASKQGAIGPVDFGFVCRMTRGQDRYMLRHGTYKKDDLFVLYLRDETRQPLLLGICDINFEEEYVAKILGIGIKDELQKKGHGTVFLAAVERECAKTNMFLIIHNPLKDEIPFYVGKGYRYLLHPNGPDFAKVLNPGFDERLLGPDR